MYTTSHVNTRRMVGLAIFSALVVILQMLGAAVRFGVFSVSLVLIPLVVGGALYGVWGGAWLGFVFGFTVLLSGDATLFLTVNAPGTILVVLLKGVLSGLSAALVYRLLEKKSSRFAAICSAVVCPLVNTGIFLLGCVAFFMPVVNDMAAAAGMAGHAGSYLLTGFVGLNFVFEVLANILLCPVAVRLIRLGRGDGR